MKRRFKTVLIPYLVWSVLYLLHYGIIYHDFTLFSWHYLPKFLFFGLASYQLYFLVIMLWFYLLMPVWIYMIRNMTIPRLGLLLILQIIFDYYSSYMISSNIANPYLKPFIEYRLNYWVFHYFFIFLLGGYAAAHYEQFSIHLKENKTKINLFFALSFAALLSHYYYLIFIKHYSAESAINTAHQLSPFGIFYTIAASLFFFSLFSYTDFSSPMKNLLSLLGHHSYFVYLFHPFAIFYLTTALGKLGFLVTAPVSLVLYFLITAISVFTAAQLRKVGDVFPLINTLLIGISARK